MRLKPTKIELSSTPFRRGWVVLCASLAAVAAIQAGDILRGGAGGNSASRRNAEARANSGAEAANVARTNAKDRLARTTAAISAVRAMQKNVNTTAVVPDGLTPGGLVRATGANARWMGAADPTQAGGTVTVRQTESQAVLHWEKFNVGRNTTLNFDQSAGRSDASKWVAFNKVFDPSGQPSQILGSIKAQGQVYVLNQNGILFGAGSQVNTRALVASSLPINDNLIENGLLNNPDAQYLFSAIPIPAGAKGTPAFIPPAPPSGGRIGDVVVEPGALIQTAVTDDGNGGRVMLVGPNVRNQGVIQTEAGQTILAAGLQVGIDAHSANDPSLRGLDVYIGAMTDGVTTYNGESRNEGLIEARRGNITMAGKHVAQMGAVDSSTSVDLNGRVDLLASYNAISNPAYDPVQPSAGAPFLAGASGFVELGRNSVTRVLPEWDSLKTFARSELPLRSQVNLRGQSIYLGSGAAILAPSATVDMKAGVWILQTSTGNPRTDFVYSNGQIYLDENALVDVAGSTNVFVPMAQYILTAQMRASELRDSPLQRDGPLRAKDLTIDLRRTGNFYGKDWVGTPLGDLTGYANLIERNVSQLTTKGGNITMQAGGSVVLRKGSIVDASGGYTVNEAGRVQTSRLWENGHLVGIEEATPDREYAGIYDGTHLEGSTKWGVSKKYNHALAPLGGYMQSEYIAGADAGTISITAPSMALDGEMAGRRVIGPRQIRETTVTSNAPKAGSLALIFEKQDATITTPLYPTVSPVAPSIVFDRKTKLGEPGAFVLGAGDAPAPISAERQKQVVLSPDLLEEKGFGELLVRNNDGDILIGSDVTLQTAPGGKIDLSGANVDVRGSIIAPGGEIALKAYTFSPYQATILSNTTGAVLPPANPERGRITVSGRSVLSAAGMMVDDRPTTETEQTRLEPIAVAGGKVSLEAFSIDLAPGSVIDVSGGAALASNAQNEGSAGSIAVLAGQDPGLPAIIGGELKLGAALRGYSGVQGGSLSIKAPLVQVGGAASREDVLVVQPEFFNQGGFSKFTLTGIGARLNGTEPMVPAMNILPGTVIAPVVDSVALAPYEGPGVGRPTYQSVFKPVGVRNPVSLTFAAVGASDNFSNTILARGDVVLGEGSVIRTDPLGAVAFDGETVEIRGSVFAPGGIISIAGGDEYPLDLPGPVALATVYIGPNSVLSAAGAAVLVPNVFGKRLGFVTSGGVIAVSGNIVAEAGAVLDVSGAAGVLDLTDAARGIVESPAVPGNSGVNQELFSLKTTPVEIHTNGGTIVLAGSELLVSEATLLGRPGGPKALGGFLSVSSGRYVAPGEASTTADINLEVTQSGVKLGPGERGIGMAVTDVNGQVIKGMGYFAADRFAAGGFSSLALGGNVRFRGPVSITAEQALLIADGGVVSADSAVNLSAAYIRVGQDFLEPKLPTEQVTYFEQTDASGQTTPFKPIPTTGAGTFTLNAPLIDVGTLVMRDIGKATFSAIGGDIRGNGTLAMAGDLILRAGQIYPTTGSAFDIFVADANGVPGSVTIEGAGTRPMPYSVGGSLSIMASVINQGGTLRAPLGSITLGWDGLGTAPTNPVVNIGTTANSTTVVMPTTQVLTLGSNSVTSVSMVDPSTGEGMLLPYGLSPDGLSWLAPSGLDVTVAGLPAKGISMGAQNLQMMGGATVDLRGGGDLYAYRWVEGNGGSVDLLATEESFAIIPGYGFNYAPYAPFNSTSGSFEGDPGYVNSQLSVGDQIRVSGSEDLAAGVYTLLPARYALLPGAVLITPREGPAQGLVKTLDGSSLVTGFRFNSLVPDRGVPAIAANYEVISGDVLRQRAEYQDFLANAFLVEGAAKRGVAVQRLPQDAGSLALQAVSGMRLDGTVLAAAHQGGRGATADIAATADIWITSGASAAPPGAINLSSSRLSSWGIESLLIGGTRQAQTDGTQLTVRTGNITVDNAGSALTAAEVILAARQTLTLAPGAEVATAGAMSSPSANLTVAGNGALLRVTSDGGLGLVRTGVTADPSVAVTVGAGAKITGGGITVDSTYRTEIDSEATLNGQSIALNSGQVIVRFDDATRPAGTYGLLLAGDALDRVQGASVLSLLSYTTFDIYGAGQLGSAGMASLAVRAGDLRGFNLGGGTVSLTAGEVLLDNAQGSTPTGGGGALDGSLVVDAGVIRIGRNTVKVSQFADVVLNAANGVMGEGTGGLETMGDMLINTPVLTAAQAAAQRLSAQGTLTVLPTTGAATVSAGLGATYTLVGSEVEIGADIILPSGALNLQATSGDVRVNGLLDLAGTTQAYYDIVRYTDGGSVNLRADAGDVVLGADSVISVAAPTDGGNAGTLSVSVSQGIFTANGELRATGGAGSKDGKFALDVFELASLGDLNAKLDAGAFRESRSLRVHSGDVLVDGMVRAHEFSLYADQGSITVAGTIDASGETGGEIALGANGSLTLLPGSLLTVAAQKFSNAGKGGNILLEAGTQRNGVVPTTSFLDIQTGAVIDLSVAALVPGSATTPGSSAFYGQFAGTLHLRAPQNAAGTDLQVNAINGTINGASSILVEGYRLYDLTSSGGTVTSAVQASVMANGNTFLGAAGTTTAGYLAMRNRLLQNNGGLESLVVLAPGAELINRTGDLTLGTNTDSTANDWNLSTYRFGPKGAAGVLTMRAAGNLVFLNSLSDGFSGGANSWLAPLMAQNLLLPINTQSWSYRLTAGADLAASSFRSTLAMSALASGKGSVMLGKNYGNANFGSGSTFQTATAIANGGRWQVIRTGSGDIDITAGRDVQLLNQFASIYTAGTQVADATTLFSTGDFSMPVLDGALNNINTIIGRQQQLYPAQYSMAGGNVDVRAGADIVRLTKASNGALIDDSSRQLPMNWLYRRGYIDPETGEFGRTGASQGTLSVVDPNASTTWWMDFSNFFEGVGALGGGDVTLTAGNDVRNVDAVAPTNARMPKGAPNGALMVELGGGDVTVSAARDISGGVYYVERGVGTLTAGGSITTNSTRSPSLGILINLNSPTANEAETWLPTTLFVGRGGFNVQAKNDVLLGPVANLFLMPSGIGNKYWYKTYFSTMGEDSFLNVTSLGGNITHRLEVTLPSQSDPIPILRAWLETQNLFSTQAQFTNIASNFQPWLRLSESTISPFNTTLSLTVPTVRSSALSGSINVVGDMTLFPSPRGTLEMVAGQSIEGLHSTGVSNFLVPGNTTRVWTAASINLSDADPRAVPGITTPFSYHSYLPAASISPTTRLPVLVSASQTATDFLSFLDAPFDESGSYAGEYGVIQTKQALHASGLLHANDANPLRMYAAGGDIQGLELFSAKQARVFADRDITDVALYLQNTDNEDISVVAAGRDLVLYNASTERRTQTTQVGNSLVLNEQPLAGDIQISGPGSLQVLAGRHIDLGTGSNNIDGTGVGITSVGNSRNPFLPFGGASIYAGAGLGDAFGLGDTGLNYDEFLDKYGAKYVEELGGEASQSLEAQAQLALEVFFLVLRDAGREAASSGDYEAGFAAISEFFGSTGKNGNIDTRSRDIRTKNGGDISIFAPGGNLTMASSIIGNPQTPPGIVTEYGGKVSIFSKGDVDIGQARIFTLRGGDIVIWSSEGDIAAGSAAKTVQTAPPTRVLVDPQSALVETDLAGLATGGGIGVLSTVEGVPAGDVDLIAPEGVVDAGDAGIRASGNVSIAATAILNADTIQAGGSTTGVPTTAPPAAPNVAGLASAANATGAQSNAANEVSAQNNRPTEELNEAPSIYEVQVLGYGGGETSEEEEEKPQGSG